MNWKWLVICFIGGSISYEILKDLGLRLNGISDFASYVLAVAILFALGWTSSDQ